MPRQKIKAKISPGNSKLGKKIPNVALVPGKDCKNCKICYKRCYARKAYRQYPAVKAAWDHNSRAARGSKRDAWFLSIDDYLTRKKPLYFRWHVAGDILDQGYYNWMCTLAHDHPNTKFLAFTNNPDINFLHRPKNMSIVLSMWPGRPKPNNRMPRSWVQDGTETRIPESAIECPGSCTGCKICWNLPTIKKDVYFHKH